MAEEEKAEEKKTKRRLRKEKKGKKNTVKELQIAYRSLEDPKKFYRTILFPLIFLGVIVFCMPFIFQLVLPIPLDMNPLTFMLGGIVPILLGVLYPYISWKNKESDINGKMHFFITHMRVLAISDLPLKDIIIVLGGNKAYGSLGEEMRKISVLSEQWRVPLAKSFRFVSERTPSKIFRDFLDRFSQSLDSGVEHREFIENEQGAVLQEYKTMYESSNDNITILSEVYTSMLISIMFIMTLGIVLPMLMGTSDMNTFLFMSSFMLLASEFLLLYLLKSMIPPDEIWHRTGQKGELEKKIERSFKISVVLCIVIGVVFFVTKYYLAIPIMQSIPLEIIIALSLTPLILPGIKTIREEDFITRKERSYMGFLPALGSISTMRGGRINDSVYYLSEKDYGVLSKHVRDLYRRLRTRINDDSAWEWFGVDTGSNYIQRSCEMFRQATAAAANPRTVSRMITENIRKIRDLRMKKFTLVKTTAALFAGITFGISFAIYISLVVGKHMNDIMLATKTGQPFEGTGIDMGAILSTVPPETFANSFLIIFLVLTLHCAMLSLTIRALRGSHKYVSLFYFVPFLWILTLTAVTVTIMLGGYFTVPSS
ncbi:MAG: type II secretion system F family protein [Euryarchaeota archaeon]|nr:type II secretion system F family protein [Euryarchaeota archaeon]